MRTYYFFILLLLPFFVFSGVIPEKSRIIFNGKNTVQSSMLVNTNEYPVVVQLWVDNGEFNKNPELIPSPFVITPVMSRMNPKKINSARIIYSGDGVVMPEDRESLFWLNIFEVPPVNKNLISENEVALSMLTQIKLIYRPKKLEISENNLIDKFDSLTFRLIKGSKGENQLVINNPTEYIASLANMELKGQENGKPVTFSSNELKSITILPKSTETVPVDMVNPSALVGIDYWLIDDSGRLIDKWKILTASQ
ncbi:fimbrial biogenesis chaperone [Metapseudomonas otitidis]|uniref:fimbrial biogenesis chaperone n=1 Tax=Metapseudomonas otitidis TaxID=319939 RepID=UPI0013F5A92B|nr:molecular chaperone [Pseudomonas otitidis]